MPPQSSPAAPESPLQKRRNLGHRLWFRLHGIGFMACLLISLLMLLGNFHYMADILTHFRQPFAFALLLQSLLLLFISPRRWAVLPLFLALYQSSFLLPHYLPQFQDQRAGLDEAESSFTLYNHNILYLDRDFGELIDQIQRLNPDLITLQEVTPRSQEALATLASAYPHRWSFPEEHAFGALIYSRFPLHDLIVHQENNIGTPLIEVTVEHPHRSIKVYATHPTPPSNKLNSATRNETIKRLAEKAQQEETKPLIITGDLNCTRYSPSLRPLVKSSLRDASLGRGYPATWNRGSWLYAIPIDHLFYSEELVCYDYRIEEKTGSDHSALFAHFRFTR